MVLPMRTFPGVDPIDVTKVIVHVTPLIVRVRVSLFDGFTFMTNPYVPVVIVGVVFEEFDDAIVKLEIEPLGTTDKTELVEVAGRTVGTPESIAIRFAWVLVLKRLGYGKIRLTSLDDAARDVYSREICHFVVASTPSAK